MILVGVALTNYKSVQGKACLDSLGTVNALIGPNNEGKSTFLEALRLTRHVREPLGNDDPLGFFLERLPDKSLDNRLLIQLDFRLEDSSGHGAFVRPRLGAPNSRR